MPEYVARLFGGLVENMGGARIDDELEIGLARDRLTFRGWCPVVFLANQDENGNRWVDTVVAERIVRDDACDFGFRCIFPVGREKRSNRTVGITLQENVLFINVGHRVEDVQRTKDVIAASREILSGFFLQPEGPPHRRTRP